MMMIRWWYPSLLFHYSFQDGEIQYFKWKIFFFCCCRCLFLLSFIYEYIDEFNEWNEMNKFLKYSINLTRKDFLISSYDPDIRSIIIIVIINWSVIFTIFFRKICPESHTYGHEHHSDNWMNCHHQNCGLNEKKNWFDIID